jgi:hypothetical protein
MVVDNILPVDFANKCLNEIMNIPAADWDRYENPFEGKYTLRDKFNMPSNLNKLFTYLTSIFFINHLSNIIGEKLSLDPTRNWWGVHKYNNGDHLDIHVDAGVHPKDYKLKKHLTLGLYLSKDWKEENGGHLEIWSGESAVNNDAKIIKCEKRILPLFNRLVLFVCNDYSWHGNPEPVKCNNGENRIFLTVSYVSTNHTENFNNNKCKAFFVPRPEDNYDEEKEKLRFLRADSEKYKQIYNMSKAHH